MNLPPLPEWPKDAQEAIQMQRDLAPRVVAEGRPDPVRQVAGVDVSVRRGQARAAVAVLHYPALDLLTHATATVPVPFPYVPGLLAFRELPAVFAALERLDAEPDVFLCDAQGLAHPRRLGLASHLGVLLDRPSVGCAKSRLVGEPAGPLAEERGHHVPLLDGEGQVVGELVRTRTGVKPIYVSVGHRVSLDWAVDFVLRCGRGVRLPEPVRQAHRLAALS